MSEAPTLPPRRISLSGKVVPGECRWCGADVPKGRRTWCSQACVDDYRIRSDPGFVRYRLKARDKGVCALCGLDCIALEKELAAMQWSEDGGFAAMKARQEELRVPSGRVTLWDADHIVPVAEGGGACGLAGYRTLCWKCHARETAGLAARLAAARRAAAPQGALFGVAT